MDLSADLLTTDGLEAVVLTVRDGLAYAVPFALRSTPRKMERERSNGWYLRADAVWHLPADDAPNQDVRPGSTVTDSTGTIWVVLETERQALTKKWRLVCSNLSLALPEAIIVQVRSSTRTATGAVEWNWDSESSLSAPTAGRIHVLGGDAVNDNNGREAIPERARIFVSSDYQFTGQHRIKDSSSRYWEIEGSESVNELDFLQTLRARRILGET